MFVIEKIFDGGWTETENRSKKSVKEKFPAIKSKRTVVTAMKDAKKVISANLTLNCFYLRRCIAHKKRENIWIFEWIEFTY